MARPPKMLMTVISSAGDRVAADELRGAVHRAVEAALLLELAPPRARASASSISPAERSASIAICLPGMASRLKRAATSAMRPEPLVMTMKFTTSRIANRIDADHDVAAHEEAAEGLDHMARGRRALMPVAAG